MEETKIPSGAIDELPQESEPIEESKPAYAFSFFIAGVQHHQMHNVLSILEEDTFLNLVPEPTNKFDPNAVRIEFDTGRSQVMLGYVPRKFSSEVAAMISIGKLLECRISTLTKTAKPWEMCRVEIREVKE